MWDLETIKHLNEGSPDQATKLWKYMKAWKKDGQRKSVMDKPIMHEPTMHVTERYSIIEGMIRQAANNPIEKKSAFEKQREWLRMKHGA